MSTINFDKVKDKFGTWADSFRPFFDSGGMDKLFSKLKEFGNEKRIILPRSNLTFRAFIETPIDQVKVVMMGMCPYHTIVYKENSAIAVADGLLMGCSITDKCQPSLVKFYEGIENELYDGLNLTMVRNPDVSYLAHQGVLMTNAALTVEVGKAGCHNDIWRPFTTFFFEEIVAKKNWPVVFLGTDAAYFKRYLSPMQWSFELYHPAFSARRDETWETNGTFKSVNKILKDDGKTEIEWAEVLPF